MFNSLPISQKLPVVVLLLSVLSAASIAVLTFSDVTKTNTQEAINRLESTEDLIHEQFHLLESRYESDIMSLSRSRAVIAEMGEFSEAYVSITPKYRNPSNYLKSTYIERNPYPAAERYKLVAPDSEDSTPYDRLHARIHGWYSGYVTENSAYRDLLMVTPNGRIVYSVGKNADFAANINDPLLKESPLAVAVRDAANADVSAGPSFSDFRPFQINGGEISAFLANAIRDDLGDLVGIMVLELSTEPFKTPLQQEDVLGDGLTALIVGADLDIRLHNNMASNLGTADARDDFGDTILFDRAQARELISAGDDAEEEESHTPEEMLVTYENGQRFFEAQGPFELFGKNYAAVWQLPYDNVMSTTTDLVKRIFWTLLICSSLFLIITAVFVRSIVKPLKTLETDLRDISRNRDLTKRVSNGSRDEIGKSTTAVDDLLSVVDAFVGEAKSGADVLLDLSSTMKESAGKMSRGSESQAAAVEELSSSLEETDAQAVSTSRSANDAAKAVRMANNAALEGGKQVSEMVHAIESISAASRDIGKIIKVINEIAFQTNILALNASVEAARAGGQGRGFSVVAQEVGNLASRSSKAAQETGALIEQSLARVKLGEEASEKTRASFGQIANHIAHASEIVDAISQASQYQMESVRAASSTANRLADAAYKTSMCSEDMEKQPIVWPNTARR